MRLLTYNIHKGIGGRDRLYRIERIIRAIEEQNPDLICLQEVDRNVRRSRYHDQPALLAEYFHAADSLYQLNVHLKTGGYGNLVLSRWPFRERHQISLRQKTRKPRGAQLVVIDSPEGPLHLVNCHLGLSAAERQWQVSRLLHHHLFRKHADLPTLLVGDFNDWRNVLDRQLLQAAGFRLVTHPISRFRSFPAWMSLGALDKVFARGDIVVTHARVVRNALTRRASDHLPVVVDFHLGQPPLASATAEAGAHAGHADGHSR
ncbi:MAG: endonuclease [Planctomycetota bacterium]|nr:MAG: endonuclease [Planctomycetota bacterium]